MSNVRGGRRRVEVGGGGGGATKSWRGVICGERLEDEIAPQDQAGSGSTSG